MQIRQFKHGLSAVAMLCAMGTTSIALVPAVAQAETTQQQVVYYSTAELDRLLAPIALYPDSLLSHVLIAATYPLEVVEAERWVRRHEHLSPQQALERAAAETWDASVKALVGTPDVLKQMSDDLQWTQAIGEAFLAQQDEVLERVQVLRDDAYVAGNLRSNKHVNVEREDRTIVIENVRREVVYVPYYDPRVVYGSWRWHDYQPVFWTRPSLTVSIGSGIYWGISYSIPSHFYFSHFYWPQRYVVINHHYYREPPKKRRDYYMTGKDSKRWYHNPRHRRGVDYRHRDLQPERPKYYMVNGGANGRGEIVRPAVSQRAVNNERVMTANRAQSPQPTVTTRNVAVQRNKRPEQDRIVRTLRDNKPARAVVRTPSRETARKEVIQRRDVTVTPRNKAPQWGDAVVRERNVRVQPKVNNRDVRQPYMNAPKQPQVSQRSVRVSPQAAPKPQPSYQTPRPTVKPAPSYQAPAKATPRGQINRPTTANPRAKQNRMQDF
ncbi:hypothetical protein CWI82_08925 [Pseudidiomarina tainanensis]|jgi:hypothetical protein|uniref:Uncharacterized protein n=1 Tax=Pseudidiomarina tainanensis TaxID=502365 RepID=A0ACD2HG26_9GAMM|nr:DUF3300 domain-containing protein [Pseudidiomarina tainanensis]RZQ55495.1 hypothetical protein CWI82_08925 [Pseudidiomarina tainanensis]